MTYDSFEAAKIANPESDIWASKLARCGRDNIFGTKVSLAELTNNYFKCNPAEHCMTVEKFLVDGHKLAMGDIVINSSGAVVDMNYSRSLSDFGVLNRASHKEFILRAAALETKEPKRTKVEYVQEKSFKEVLKCAIDGEVFYSKDGKGEFKFDVPRMSFVNHDGADMEIAYLTNHELYRRIETPIEWWEDSSEFINQTDDDNCSSIMEGKLHVNATLTQDQWCDFARILLEQGE